MEKKITRDMVCEEFKGACKECPLSCRNNFKTLSCWKLGESDIQNIMKDYPYVDVKIRMMFNDIETRLTAVEEKVSNNVSVEFKPERVVFGCSYNRDIGFSAEVVDKKLYDKLEAKHEADCRLISEYDIENNKLEDEIDKYRRHIAELKDELFDLKNAENERDHYKGLYSSMCDDYDALLEKQLKTEKDFEFYRDACYKCCSANDDHIKKEHDLKEEVIKLTELKDNYKNLFLSLNHKHQEVVGEIKKWKERAMEAEKKLEKPEKLRKDLERENDGLRETLESVSKDYDKLKSECYIAQENLKITKEKYDDARKMNKMREDVFEANLKLKKTIEAKDREIDLLRAELDKYKTDDECDDRWID